jgi:hypothetical protein
METWLKFLRDIFPGFSDDEIQLMVASLLMHSPLAESVEEVTAGGL